MFFLQKLLPKLLIYSDIGFLPVSTHNNDCGLHNLKVNLEKLGDLDHLELRHHLPVENACQEDCIVPGSKHVSEEHKTVQGELNSFKVNIYEHLWVTSHCIA